jgi:drug/metabolite transporter (DMT)-like permease
MRSRIGAPESIFFVLLAAAWGSSYLAVAIAGVGLEPFTLVALRLAIGAVALAVVAIPRREARPTLAVTPHLVVIGALGIALPFTLITYGERTIDAGLASIIVATAPLLTAAIGASGVTGSRDRSVGRVGVAGLAIGFAGVLLVAGGGLGSGIDPAGMLMLSGAAVSYAANGLYARRYLGGVPPMTIALGQAVSALAITATLGLIVDGIPTTVPSVPVLLAAVWLGLVASGLAPVLYFRLIAAWGPVRTTTVNYLTPIVGVVGGAVLLGERLPAVAIAGGALVIVGVALANLPRTMRGPRRLPAIRPLRLAARPGTP